MTTRYGNSVGPTTRLPGNRKHDKLIIRKRQKKKWKIIVNSNVTACCIARGSGDTNLLPFPVVNEPEHSKKRQNLNHVGQEVVIGVG